MLPSVVLPSVSSSPARPAVPEPIASGPTASTPESLTPILSAMEANVAPLPCAYTPPDLAPLLDVKRVAKSINEIIVSDDAEDEAKTTAEPTVVVKGLEELVADVQRAKEPQERREVQAAAS